MTWRNSQVKLYSAKDIFFRKTRICRGLGTLLVKLGQRMESQVARNESYSPTKIKEICVCCCLIGRHVFQYFMKQESTFSNSHPSPSTVTCRTRTCRQSKGLSTPETNWAKNWWICPRIEPMHSSLWGCPHLNYNLSPNSVQEPEKCFLWMNSHQICLGIRGQLIRLWCGWALTLISPGADQSWKRSARSACTTCSCSFLQGFSRNRGRRLGFVTLIPMYLYLLSWQLKLVNIQLLIPIGISRFGETCQKQKGPHSNIAKRILWFLFTTAMAATFFFFFLKKKKLVNSDVIAVGWWKRKVWTSTSSCILEQPSGEKTERLLVLLGSCIKPATSGCPTHLAHVFVHFTQRIEHGYEG